MKGGGPGSHPGREASVKGGQTTAQKTRLAREARWEDIDFMMSAGYSPRFIAQRLGISAQALSRQAYRMAEVEEESELWLHRAQCFNYSRKDPE